MPLPVADDSVSPEDMPIATKASVLDKLLGTNGQERYQLWPERLVRDALSAPHDVMNSQTPLTSQDLIKPAMDVSALAGTGGLGGAEASLGSGPFLRPALKYDGKIFKAPVGGQHMDAIPKDLQAEFTRQAMNGEDISNFNFGFMNHKGQFLDREKAMDYAVKEGLLDPHDASQGALTSTVRLNADSSKEGAALDTLYHGTTTDAANLIDKEGILPQRGKFINKMYGEDASDDIVSMADKNNIKNVKTAIVNQIAEKLNKSRLNVTDKDIENHGVMYSIKKNNDEHLPYDYDAPVGVEKGDHYSANAVNPSGKITGKDLVEFLK